VATSYAVQGDTIVQTVKHAGSMYPVVADPRAHWWWGGVDVYLSRGEMIWIRNGGMAAYTYYVPASYLGAIGLGSVTGAIDNALPQNKCVVLHLSWVRPSYTWLYNC
jgi:hypothetical protein